MNAIKKIRVLVTGATGFLGGNILTAMAVRPEIELIAACRRREKLPQNFKGEVRVGNLMDPNYRRAVVKKIDVICNAGNWASMWSHKELERQRFFEPTRDLIEQAIRQGVKRFIQTSTVAIGAVEKNDKPLDDFSKTKYTGFWPHLDYLIDLDR